MTKITASNEDILKMTEALRRLQSAVADVSRIWHSVDLNQLETSELYPFENDFEKVSADIHFWAASTINELKQSMKMYISGHGHENTGGGCMVTFLTIEGHPTIKEVGIDDEYIIGYNVSYYASEKELEKREGLMRFETYEQLRAEFPPEVTLKIIKAYHDYLDKYNLKGRLDKL